MLIWHVARNALIPFVTVMLPEIPNILTGSIFIESIFRIPGLGRFFVTRTFSRDYPMILALVLLVAVLWGITYLLTDLLYTAARSPDPSDRLSGGGDATAMATRLSGATAARVAPAPSSRGAPGHATPARALRRFVRQRLAMVGLVDRRALLLVALFAPLLAPTALRSTPT